VKRGYGREKMFVWIIMMGMSLWISSPVLAASPDLRLTPQSIEIGAFFTGAQLKVAGEIPTGSNAVVEVVGDSHEVSLMRKGRRLGLWMNVGTLEVHEAPTVYIAGSTDTNLLSNSGSDSPWGYGALEKRVTFSGDVKDGEQTTFFHDFLELKESEKLYSLLPGSIKVAGSGSGWSGLEDDVWIPAKIPPGTYHVCMSIVQDGKTVERKCSDLQVAQVGFPALLYSMAYQHGLAYGIIAVLIAIFAGFAMGFMFKGKGGGAH
jgi:uncharacterized protein (TIGR02186 family)